MKNIIILILLIVSTISYSQSRIGYSKARIEAEYNNYHYSRSSGYIKETGVSYVTVYISAETYIKYLFKEDKCFRTILNTTDRGLLHSKVEELNNKYTIISDIEWKCYFSTGVMTIKLIISFDNYMFSFD
jgi:hypothetical protein